MSLRIGIDARKLHDFGIGRYLQGLLGGLAELRGDEEYVLFLAPGPDGAVPEALRARLDPARFRTAECRAPLYSVREMFAFRGAGARHGLDVLHFPHYARGFFPGCPVVVTIHDATHLAFPESWAARLYAALMMRWSARHAAAVLTVSEAARAEIAEAAGIAEARIGVTPNGVDGFAPPDEEHIRSFRSRHDLPGDYVLCVGSHRPHKNLSAALQAAERCAPAGGPGAVVPARDAAAADALRPSVSRHPAARIVCPVRDEDLPALYAGARVVVVPSLAEGFGLVGLEAAACGAAVLATPLPAHREVLGDAAAYADSGTAEDLSRALGALLGDSSRLAALRGRGPGRALRFSWRRTAELTRTAYRSVISPPLV